MKAKEKAEKLISSIYRIKKGMAIRESSNYFITYAMAKQCALICVGEKIDLLIKIRRLIGFSNLTNFIKEEKNLQKVKQEINNL